MSRHKRPNIQTADSITIDPDCHDLEIIPRELSSEMDPSTGSSDMLFDPSVSDYVLDEKIESYKSYLRNLNTNDGGVKLKLHLERLEKEKARRELQKKTGCQAQVIEETNASAQLSDKRDCLDSEITPSNAWLASPNGRFGPSSGQECSPFSPKSNKSESTTKLCSQADRSANKIRHANDLEGSSSEVKHGVCPSCCQKPPSSKISADTNGEQNQFLCTQCNRDKSILSHASMPTPTNLELCKETLSKTPRRRTSGRSCVGKQGHGGCGGTVDTAMEVSDDEEKETVLACVSPASCSSHHPRRQGLRSAFKRKAGLKVAYPSSDDPEAIEVQYGDLQHLDPFEFLNDTVIDFYIKYIQIEKICSPEKSRHFHFFNSFFYKKLLTGKKKLKGDDGFLKLRKWTKGTNIFEKSYLLMPIHDRAHWSLAIICFPKADENIDVLQAHILHLDSMTSTSGHTSQDIFRVLKSYLETEWRYLLQEHVSDQEVLKETPLKSSHRRVQVPLQDNEWDCGLFMLYYIERFVQEAPVQCKSTDFDKMFGRSWFKPDEASQLREIISKLLQSLFDLHVAQSKDLATGYVCIEEKTGEPSMSM